MYRRNQLTLGRQDDDERFRPSTIPSTQDDLKQLEDRFQMMLYKEFALESGVCPKRRQIYDDLFNELIRITKVHCSERGLLLERIRDEYKQWMNTYEELYSSSMGYSIRQYLYKSEEKKNFEMAINILENDCQQLRAELERESMKYQNLNQLNEDNELNALRGNVKTLKATNKKLRKDLDKALGQILSSAIFLSEPINYDKKTK
jgi:dynein light intermediate chain